MPRLPHHALNIISSIPIQLPLVSSSVSAGFPSPAEDSVDIGIDLNKLLIQHPASTFVVRAQGNSMTRAGILQNDYLLIDRSRTARPGDIVVAYYEDGFLVKRLQTLDGCLFLCAESEHTSFRPLPVTEAVTIWGVVSGVVRKT